MTYVVNIELPEYLAEYLCDLAEVDTDSSVLVYSYGTNIIDAICRRNPKGLYDTKNQIKEDLHGTPNKAMVCIPFLDYVNIDQIRTMYEHLESGGIFVGLVNLSLFYTNIRTTTDFTNFLINNNAVIKDLPKDIFAEIGEDVNVCIVKITK